MKDKNAIEAVAYTMELYPNNGLRANVGIIAETTPKEGKINI